jgi:glycine cleavage system H lipoate-binding protein
MTLQQAIENVKFYERHQWAFEVTDDGTVVVGGTDHGRSEHEARKNGFFGPIHRVYDT